jgi:hypothetical protein
MRSHFQKILRYFSGIFLTLPLGAQALRVDAVPGVSGKAGKYGINVIRAFAVSRDAKKAPLHDVSADIEILK